MSGINIDIEEFKELPMKQQIVVLYENTEKIKNMITKYKYHQRMQWMSIGLLFVLGGIGKYLNII